MKQALAVTKPIFLPAAVLPLSHACSDVSLTGRIQTRRQFRADTTSSISLEFPAQPQGLTVFVDKLMHTLGVS